MIKCLFTFLFALACFLPQSASAAVFYVDFVNGLDSNAGTASTTAFQSLNQFANNARNAGDIAFVRRGMASTTSVTAVTFTSDGTLNQPITISADYDNIWSDFATTSQTYTFAFGSTTITASAAQSDVIVGDWLYAQGDCSETDSPTVINSCEFAYEVSAVASTSINFYLPYKGTQAGAGIAVRKMPFVPQVGTATEAAQIFTMSNDDYWYFKGLDLRSTNVGGIISLGSNRGTKIKDIVLQGNGASDRGINSSDNGSYGEKIRIYNVDSGFRSGSGSFFKDVLINCNNTASSRAIDFNDQNSNYQILDMEVINCTNIGLFDATISGARFSSRNFKNNNTQGSLSGSSNAMLYFEDNFGIVGLNSQTSNQISANAVSTTTISDTANLRAGGGPTNTLVYPPTGSGNTGISTFNFPLSYQKLFEYPIYSDTNPHTYSMYFMSTSTADWSVNPTTSTLAGSSTPELFIECEYYANTFDASRMLMRSTTTSAINFTGSTAWQALTLQCTPQQAGVLYLRGWYGKPVEGTLTNWFFMDNTPVVTSP